MRSYNHAIHWYVKSQKYRETPAYSSGVAQKALGYPTPVTAPLVPRTALDTSNDKITIAARVRIASGVHLRNIVLTSV